MQTSAPEQGLVFCRGALVARGASIAFETDPKKSVRRRAAERYDAGKSVDRPSSRHASISAKRSFSFLLTARIAFARNAARWRRSAVRTSERVSMRGGMTREAASQRVR